MLGYEVRIKMDSKEQQQRQKGKPTKIRVMRTDHGYVDRSSTRRDARRAGGRSPAPCGLSDGVRKGSQVIGSDHRRMCGRSREALGAVGAHSMGPLGLGESEVFSEGVMCKLRPPRWGGVSWVKGCERSVLLKLSESKT